MSEENKIIELEQIACKLRQHILTMIYKAQSGHPGGSLSAADIMATLYFHEMKTDSKNPKWEGRDRFVLSKGHCCPALYASLIEKGFLEQDEINTLRELGSRLQGHPDMKKTPGVEISTGSLGQGIGAAVGMAIGLKIDGKSENQVFALLGDGECAEGMVWESVQVAAKYNLDNLTIIVDKNRLQNDGFAKDIMPLGDLAAKFKAFGCETVEVEDGHDMSQLVEAFDKIRDIKGKPHCVITNNIKGKGVSFMENVPKWHGIAPNDEEYEMAMKEVKEAVR